MFFSACKEKDEDGGLRVEKTVNRAFDPRKETLPYFARKHVFFEMAKDTA
jgi:hypothetical protein